MSVSAYNTAVQHALPRHPCAARCGDFITDVGLPAVHTLVAVKTAGIVSVTKRIEAQTHGK